MSDQPDRTKRYILLAGDSYEAAGWSDFRGTFDTVEDAVAAAEAGFVQPSGWTHRPDWWEVIDRETLEVVA